MPKILLDDVPMRAAERDTQLGEQLVEVPTNPGYALAVVVSKLCSRRDIRQKLQGRGGGGARGGLQGARPGQDSTAFLEQIVEIPVPQHRQEGGGGLQGSLPVQNSAAVLEQIVDIPARRGLPGSLSGQGSASSSSRFHDAADEDFTGVLCRTAEARGDSKGAVLGQVVTCPLFQLLKPVKIPQVQFLDEVVFMPVACRQFWGPDVQKTVVFHSCSLGKVADVPARAVHRRLWTSLCLCSDVWALAGRASDSVHRQRWWTFQLQRLWVRRGSGGDEGVGAHHIGDELN